MKLFSKFYEKKQTEDQKFFRKNNLNSAYLIGAYASAIIESSWDGIYKVVDEKKVLISRVYENETFKKWLSNQQITYKSMLKIIEKASYFHRKFNLDSAINNDLSTLVTNHFHLQPKEASLDQEISFAFLRGFNDFRTFKYTKEEEI